jgi:hypothetical protein
MDLPLRTRPRFKISQKRKPMRGAQYLETQQFAAIYGIMASL